MLMGWKREIYTDLLAITLLLGETPKPSARRPSNEVYATLVNDKLKKVLLGIIPKTPKSFNILKASFFICI